jgi:beta-glucosidase
MGGMRRIGIQFVVVALLAVSLQQLPLFVASGAVGSTTLADFEGGLPGGWFTFNGGASSVAASIETKTDVDPLALPGQVGDNDVLRVDFTIGDFGGFGDDFGGTSQDWSGYDAFGFWFNGTGSGLSYQAEIFDNSTSGSSAAAERFDFNFKDDIDGWRFVTIPFSSFTRATDFQPPGAPDDGLTLTEMWGWAVILPFGGPDTAYFDDFRLIDLTAPDLALGQAVAASSIEGPGLEPENAVDGDSGTRWASAFSDPQWIYVDLGTPTLVDQVLLNWEAAFGSAYEIQVSDDAAAWTSVFAETGGNGGVDALNVCGTGRYVRMFGTSRGTPFGYSLFDYEVYGDGAADFTVGFDAADFSVTEGDLATITVSTCNRTGATQTLDIMATAATADGTARAGDDYTSVATSLALPPGTGQVTFDVPTLDDSANEDAETVLLSIVDGTNATVSGRGEATLTIGDNDAAPSPALDSLLIDDFESGIPPGFFTFGGENPAIALVPEPLPGVPGPNTALRVDYNIFSFGGIVHDITPAQDWSGFDAARFWFFGENSGNTYQFEIKDGGAGPAASELWEVFFVDDFTGWRQLVFPFDEFQIRTSFQPTGGPINGTLDLTDMFGYAFNLPIGTGPGTFLLDNVEVYSPGIVLDDFEDPVPFGFPEGIFTFGGNPGDDPLLTPAPEPAPRPGAAAPNQVLQVDYDIEFFGGLVHNITFDTNPQDWSSLEGFRFWFFGTNLAPLPPGSGPRIQLEIKDGGANAEASELWEVFFTDDFAGWTQLVIPFEDFRLRTSFQPTGGPINGTLDLDRMWGYAMGLPSGVPDQTFFLDQVEVFGFALPPARAVVDFDQGVYLVDEGETATVGVVLDTPDGNPLSDPVTVDYSTGDGTATAGSDYTPASGEVTFDAGDPPGTVETFSVATLADPDDETAETIVLSLDTAPDVRTGGNTPGTVVINAHGFPYLDPGLSVEDRVDDLLSRMTLAEKVGQMTLIERAALDSPGDIATFLLGALLSGGGSAPTPNTPESWADMVDGFQAQALATRLQIPMIYGVDAVHGHNNVVGATIFPHNIGLGATRNPGLVEEIGRVTAEEVYATGVPWDFSPCVCVARDVRWGRTYESFGEDAALASMMATIVDGLQGDDLGDPGTVLATAKHWVGDGGTTFGSSTTGSYTIDQGITEATLEELREIHIPPYEEAIARDVGVIMPSYSSADFGDGNGPLKMHAHAFLNNDVLKGELGFDGFIVSDWQGIDQIPGDRNSDVRTGVNAGIDMVMVPFDYRGFTSALLEEVGLGNVTTARIDDAVHRILTKKFELGLFEQPFADRTDIGEIGSPAHRAVARQAVRESLVLLKNQGDLLPLVKDLNVYVAGRNANDVGNQSGGWTISWQGSSGPTTPGTTILDGVAGIVDGGATVTFSQDASAPTAGHDVGIVVVGETPYAEGVGDVGNVIPDLSLDTADQAAIDTVCGALPCVVVVVSGRPMIVTDQLDDMDAFVAAWLPGTEGDGVAEVLFGDFGFSGRLPVSWPRDMAQIPINVGDPGYDPLFAYGFGLRAPRVAKAQTGAELEALLPTGNAGTDRRILKAIDWIEASLDPGRWETDYSLDHGGGKQVFDRERQAVEELMKVKSGPVADDITAVVDALVAADAELARRELAEAHAAGGDQATITKSQQEYARAEGELANGHPDRAIHRYRKAWEFAVKAQR